MPTKYPVSKVIIANSGADLNSPAVHWVIEICAVITHVMLVVSVYLLFIYKDKKQQATEA